MSEIEVPTELVAEAYIAGLCEVKGDAWVPTELGLKVLRDFLARPSTDKPNTGGQSDG